jgi:hypothetical protein
MSKIDISFIDNYVPKANSVKFFSFCNMMWEDDDNTTPLAHYYFADEVMTSEKRFSAQCHRGFAKSTIISHRMPLFIATFGVLPSFGEVNNCCILSDTFDQSEAHRKTMMSYYDRSDVLQSFLKVERSVEGEVVFINNKGHRTRFFCKGTGQSFRGSNWEGHRPDLIIGDDILNDDILYNKDLVTKQKTWFSSVVSKAVNIRHYKMIMIGTPLLENDLLGMFAQSPSWHNVKLPVCQEFPVPKNEIKSLWPDRFTPDAIYEEYLENKSMGEESTFFREMMLQVVNEETQIFKKEYIKHFKISDIAKEKHKYNFFTTMDLAVSKKEKADRTCIMTIAVNSDNHWFIVGLDFGRFTPTEVLDMLFKQVRRWKPLEVRAEKAALQQVLGHFIEDKMLKENTHFYYNSLILNSTTKKEVRILGLEPKLKRRMIWFASDDKIDEFALLEKELLSQTKETNTSGHDDGIDTLASFLDEGFVVTPNDYLKDYNGEIVQQEIIDSTVF